MFETFTFIINNVYHNFFTVCALIPTVFSIVTGIIFLAIKNRSKASKNLGLGFIFMGLFFFGYFIAAVVYHPIGAFHRWITVFNVFACFMFYMRFCLFFPDENSGKAMKYTSYVITFVSILVFLSFVIYSVTYGKIYFNFESHNYEFEANIIDKFLPLYILFLTVSILAFGIWKTIITKDKSRWSVFFIILLVFIGIFIPGIANILSRFGYLGRDIYQVTQDLSSLFGYFAVSIIYINSTKDRTTFFTKIITITFATFLLVFQIISFFNLKDLEKSYNLIKNIETRKIITSVDKEYSNDLEYLYSIDLLNESPPELNFNRNQIEMDNISLIKYTMLNSYIMDLVNNSNYQKLKVFFDGSSNYSLLVSNPLYLTLREEFLKTGESKFKNDFITFSQNLNKKLFFLNKKVELSVGTMKNILKITDKENDAVFKYYKKAIEDFKISCADESMFKNGVLSILATASPNGEHIFRSGKNNQHYISYIAIDYRNNIIYEAGYSYISFRKFLHPTGMVMLLCLVFIIVIILFGFRYFFMFTIIKPLNRLQGGIEIVQKGDFNVRVDNLVNDEVGYISRAFNTMIEKIALSEKSLADYANNLEIKVEERTVELKEANEETKKTLSELHLIHREIKEQLEMAKIVQDSIIPKVFPETGLLDIYGRYYPMDDLGGDYYDVIKLSEDKIIFVIADVSGHGAGAALVTTMMKVSFRNNSVPNKTTGEIIESVNKELLQIISGTGHYLTAFVCSIDLITGKMEYTNAGHNEIYFLNGHSEIVELKTNSFYIGFRDVKFKSERVKLKKGDRVILYTDGIPELQNAEKNLYGHKRFQSIITKYRSKKHYELIDKLQEDLEFFSNGQKATDDKTILIIDIVNEIGCVRFNTEKFIEMISNKIAENTTHNDEVENNLNNKLLETLKMIKNGKNHEALDKIIEIKDSYKRKKEMFILLSAAGYLSYKAKKISNALDFYKEANSIAVDRQTTYNIEYLTKLSSLLKQ